MSSDQLLFSKTVGRFFLGPFSGHPVSGPLVVLVILALAVLLYGRATVLELSAQNCLDADAIAGEMLKPTGAYGCRP